VVWRVSCVEIPPPPPPSGASGAAKERARKCKKGAERKSRAWGRPGRGGSRKRGVRFPRGARLERCENWIGALDAALVNVLSSGVFT